MTYLIPSGYLTVRRGIDGPNRNRWFTVLKHGGSFHGKLLNSHGFTTFYPRFTHGACRKESPRFDAFVRAVPGRPGCPRGNTRDWGDCSVNLLWFMDDTT